MSTRYERPCVAFEQTGSLTADPEELRTARDTTGIAYRSDYTTARTRGFIPSVRRGFVIDVELAPWSDTTTEIAVRPTTRAPHRWSDRRRRRWYESAHAAADALRNHLLHAAPEALPRRLAVGCCLRTVGVREHVAKEIGALPPNGHGLLLQKHLLQCLGV